MQGFLPWCWALLQLTDGLRLSRTTWLQRLGLLKQGECRHQLGSAATQAPGRGWGTRWAGGSHCREEWGGRGSPENRWGSYRGHRSMSRRDVSH